MENKYKNGVIYKIFCKDPTITDVYVGSTCDLTNRKYKHKHSCNNENGKAYNFYLYQFIRENEGWSNWDMIELIKYPCETKRELELKEREYLELLSATLNKHIPTRSKNEYCKAYRLANKEQISEKMQIYYVKNIHYILIGRFANAEHTKLCLKGIIRNLKWNDRQQTPNDYNKKTVFWENFFLTNVTFLIFFSFYI